MIWLELLAKIAWLVGADKSYLSSLPLERDRQIEPGRPSS